ncbi:MAG: class I SAM-dependent methyltransferase [Labilithrix sp.]|nr:class I SAM-dependent methyltransferase [Labilithrix sp.]
MYTVADYGRMAADVVRMDAYRRAIAATVRPGSVVLDLGAGTGIMSLLAVRAGARRVHAVDPSSAVWLIPELARDNSVEEGRIVVHQSSSLEMDVPEPVDVVIADMRGATPLLEHNIRAIQDAHARWLAPGGVVVPARDRLGVVLVEAEGMGRHLDDSSASFERLGFRADAARRSIRNQVYTDNVAPLAASDMLSATGTWALLDYRSPSDAKRLEGTVALDVKRGGTARGLAVFFDAELCPNVEFTTSPGHNVVYNRLYLPLLTPVVVAPGDRVTVTLRADDHGQEWAWDTTIEREGAALGKQRQSTFLGLPSSMSTLLRGSEHATPNLGKKGKRLLDVLAKLDGTRTIAEVADDVVGSGPREHRGDVLELVRAVAMRYGA